MTLNTSNEFLPKVERPSRYLGGELGAVSKDPATVDISMALAFPDVYEIGMSHLGLAVLYQLLNDIDWIAAERVYSPWPDLETQLRASGDVLRALESERPLRDFDIIGFTLQYELSYTNILTILDLAGIPRRRDRRFADLPLIVAGGPCAFNPEPLADFCDCFIIGDGEEAVVELCSAVRESRRIDEGRGALLTRLSRIEGCYVPELFTVSFGASGQQTAITPLRDDYRQVRRRFLADLENAPWPTRPVVPFTAAVHDRVAIEIARGCTRGCRFCQAGYIYRPVRERSPERIAQLANAALHNSGHCELSLLSLSSGDYSSIEALLHGLMDRYRHERVAVSLPSLRVGSLTPELMEEIKKVRKTGFTLAPEAGSERLRQVINKGISAADLVTATSAAYQLGWRTIKLYFMLGLPTETDADLDAIIDLSAQVKRSGKGTAGGADANVAVSTFVPKPHTPFQWEAQLDVAETIRRQRYVRDGLRNKKLRLKWHEAEMSFLEGVFARGDRRLAAVLERAVDLGCRFDGWRDHFRFDLWQQAFTEAGIDAAFYLRQRDEDEVLPWDHIDCGIPKAFLLDERHKAFALEYTPDCRGGACSGCGVCDFETLRMRLVENSELSAPPEQPLLPVLVDGEEERHKVRLRLAKRGKARFVGHLEFMTAIHRAARRSGLPVRFSQGFHPAPRISFGDALSLGIESEAELIDFELTEERTPQCVAAALGAQLPPGFHVLDAQALVPGAPSPGAAIAASIYEVTLAAPATGLAERVAAFVAATAVEVDRPKKQGTVRVDIRPAVMAIDVTAGRLRITLRKGSPLVLLAHLFGLELEDARRLPICKVDIISND
ncbi:MAG: TIGR03960 family B12-binding radical SAM protein [Desulfuromonadaceae bacterium]|nr:TIGR03960 family B12-binding radical SAM protein [Desulfuromonadaceae bacterium]